MSVDKTYSLRLNLKDKSCKSFLPLVFPLFPDGLFCFCCGSLYDSPFSFLFLALSGASSDEDEEEDDDGGDDDEGGGGGDEFSCVQFGSRYRRNGVLPLHVPST